MLASTRILATRLVRVSTVKVPVASLARGYSRGSSFAFGTRNSTAGNSYGFKKVRISIDWKWSLKLMFPFYRQLSRRLSACPKMVFLIIIFLMNFFYTHLFWMIAGFGRGYAKCTCFSLLSALIILKANFYFCSASSQCDQYACTFAHDDQRKCI